MGGWGTGMGGSSGEGERRGRAGRDYGETAKIKIHLRGNMET